MAASSERYGHLKKYQFRIGSIGSVLKFSVYFSVGVYSQKGVKCLSAVSQDPETLRSVSGGVLETLYRSETLRSADPLVFFFGASKWSSQLKKR